MFKFLDPTGATYYDGKPFYYVLPRPDQRWSDPTEHPDPAVPNGHACGPGRLHLMKQLSAVYAPDNWWPWWAKGIGPVIGEDGDKAAFGGVRLRRIAPKVLHRALRPPFNWGQGAYLRRANLGRANLRGANLRRAHLWRADLGGADLWNANLRGANLGGANLWDANLRSANLRGANLWDANLRGANLRGANLRSANLGGANLGSADLRSANLRGANLWNANLGRADHNALTQWPADFDKGRLT